MPLLATVMRSQGAFAIIAVQGAPIAGLRIDRSTRVRHARVARVYDSANDGEGPCVQTPLTNASVGTA